MTNCLYYFATLSFFIGQLCANGPENRFPLAIIHINDFHDRFEEVTLKGGRCDDKTQCIGGYARLVTVVKQLKKQHKTKHVLYLNAGDNFQGTAWYSLMLGNVTADVFKLLPPDAMCLGNHEFDHRPENLAIFLDAFRVPVLAANMVSLREPTIRGKTQRFKIFKKGNREIGVIGVTFDGTHLSSSTGNVTFTNSTKAVITAANRLKQRGVNIVIVLSHCGYEIEIKMAKRAKGLVDVIVGGHSHTYLYNGPRLPTGDPISGPYPTVVQHRRHKTLVVQAGAYSKYVGNLIVNFDDAGEILDWEGGPVFVGHNVTKDAGTEKKLTYWRELVNRRANAFVATVDQMWDNDKCYERECEVGLLIADAFLTKLSTPHHPLNAAFLQTGGIRADLPAGNITYGHLLNILPFGSSIDVFDLQGRYLRETLENAAIRRIGFGKFLLQVSGMMYKVDYGRPERNRISDVKIGVDGKLVNLDDDRTYTLATSSFLLQGGDHFTVLKDHKQNVRKGEIDIDIVSDYLRNMSKVTRSSLINCPADPCRLLVTGLQGN